MPCARFWLGAGCDSMEPERTHSSPTPFSIGAPMRNNSCQDDNTEVSSAETPWARQIDACAYSHRVKSAVGGCLTPHLLPAQVESSTDAPADAFSSSMRLKITSTLDAADRYWALRT